VGGRVLTKIEEMGLGKNLQGQEIIKGVAQAKRRGGKKEIWPSPKVGGREESHICGKL